MGERQVETVETSGGTHQGITRLRDKWRLRETRRLEVHTKG